jgi:general secretion pathway protein B
MSFILDALRKSESERQVQDTPGFADVPQATQRSPQPVWVWAIGALLAVNILVLIGVLLRPDSNPSQPAIVDTRATEAPPLRNEEPVPVEVIRETPPKVVATALPANSESTSDTQAAAPISTAVETNPTPRAKRIVSQPRSGPAVRDGLKSLNELRAAGLLQLGDLHIDIHVYSEQIEDRFVFVNMRKYKERATLDEGPLIREITPDGVVLEHSGIRFLLPRE